MPNSEADWRRLLDQHSGKTARQIAEDTGHPIGTIRYVASRFGYTLKPARKAPRSWESCFDAGMTAVQAAKARGTKAPAAYQWAMSTGRKWPNAHETRGRNKGEAADMPRPSWKGLGPKVNVAVFGANFPAYRHRLGDGSFPTMGDLARLENRAAVEACR